MILTTLYWATRPVNQAMNTVLMHLPKGAHYRPMIERLKAALPLGVDRKELVELALASGLVSRAYKHDRNWSYNGRVDLDGRGARVLQDLLTGRSGARPLVAELAADIERDTRMVLTALEAARVSGRASDVIDALKKD